MAGPSSFHGRATALALVLALVLGVGWLVLRGETYVAPTPDRPAREASPGEAAAALGRLEAAVRGRDPEAAAALAPQEDPRAAARLASLADNARAVDVRGFTLRYVDALDAPDEQGRWSATVSASWRFAGFDRRPSVADVEVELQSGEGRTGVVRIGGPEGLSPVWMTGPVEVLRGPRLLVVAAGDPERYGLLARRAVPVVRRVLPGWRTGLVVEVPDSAQAVDAALGAEPGSYGAIAAVTTPVGDAVRPGVPVHVLVNPEVFGSLNGRGAQVVMSHEAAHVATGAATEPDVVPTWLSEGYADYVALRDVDLPLSVTAAQVARQVRRDGPPRRLPGPARFGTRTTHLGAAYEASWIACRLLAARSGEQALTRFYTGLRPGDDVAGRFERSFGLSVTAFTRQWRRALRGLAG